MKLRAILLSCICLGGLFFMEGTRVDAASDEKDVNTSQTKKAVFAGGCFWCIQPPFDKLDGVLATRVGYTGGSRKNPSYEQVASGATAHTEAIEVEYDPEKVSYEKLLEVF